MRRVFLLALSSLACVGVASAFAACSSSSGSGFQNLGGPDTGTIHIGADGGVGRDTGIIQIPKDGGMLMQKPPVDSSTPPADGTVIMMTKTTIYAHTDTELYSMDPMTHDLTDIGTFSGTSGSYYDSTITDLAVDAAGDIYVNSEIVVYKVTLPATPGPGAKVALTQFVNTSPGLKDGGDPSEKFYALAFAPAGAIPSVQTLPSGETLVAGDNDGNIWVIEANGTPIKVGNFGTDPNIAANFLALSGDLVFYTSSTGAATGLATIRSCPTADPTKCVKTNDYLAGINMANLKANAAAPTGTLASLLGGIYGGTTTTDGNGTTKAEIFGLGAWQGDVYGFARCYECYDGGTNTPASLLQIDPTSGAATVLNSNFPFTDGWSGAGVSTKVTVTVIAPPPTMPPMSK